VPTSTTTTSATKAPAVVTTTVTTVPVPTTVDPGTLPQTMTLPSATDPAFVARMDDLVQAIVTGNTSVALPAFFPLSAYIQVKDISNPTSDWNTRLVADYNQDIAGLHAGLKVQGESAEVTSITIPPGQAQWILPGVEYNKGSYWRVYNAVVNYSVDNVDQQFTVASLISWRGEWYVVHLSSIR
jgi:hypothetical protein